MAAAKNAGKVDSSADESLAQLGAELWRRAHESQEVLATAWDGLLRHWGIVGEPMGVVKLREMIHQESGEEPSANNFSREIVTLREERRP